MSNETPDDDLVETPSLPAPADQSLEAAVKWLEAESLTAEQRAAISRGTEDVSSKLEVFKVMLGVQRASRLAQNMGWLRDITDMLAGDAAQARAQTDPYFALSVGQFLRALQEDDTKFLLALAKDPNAVSEARKKAEASDNPVKDKEMADALNKLAPHNRERLRKFIQALEKPQDNVDSAE